MRYNTNIIMNILHSSIVIQYLIICVEYLKLMYNIDYNFHYKLRRTNILINIYL